MQMILGGVHTAPMPVTEVLASHLLTFFLLAFTFDRSCGKELKCHNDFEISFKTFPSAEVLDCISVPWLCIGSVFRKFWKLNLHYQQVSTSASVNLKLVFASGSMNPTCTN